MLKIKFDERFSLKGNLLAAMNYIDWVCKEMSNGRVKQAQDDITTNKTEAEQGLLQVQADIIEGVVDEYNTVIGG